MFSLLLVRESCCNTQSSCRCFEMPWCSCDVTVMKYQPDDWFSKWDCIFQCEKSTWRFNLFRFYKQILTNSYWVRMWVKHLHVELINTGPFVENNLFMNAYKHTFKNKNNDLVPGRCTILMGCIPVVTWVSPRFKSQTTRLFAKLLVQADDIYNHQIIASFGHLWGESTGDRCILLTKGRIYITVYSRKKACPCYDVIMCQYGDHRWPSAKLVQVVCSNKLRPIKEGRSTTLNHCSQRTA